MTAFHMDYEGKSECDLKAQGLDHYSLHPSTEITMCAGAFDDDDPELWIPEVTWRGTKKPFPKEWEKALLSKDVEKWAFNAQFERVMTRRVMKIKTPYEGWRCAMVLGHMLSFIGDLEQMGERVGLPSDKQKVKDGKRLINLFCKPRKPTKNNPSRWNTPESHPEDWELFCAYCLQDVVAERAIKKRLIKFPVGPGEWELYEIDQRINDRGMPVDMEFVENAIWMADRRKKELTSRLEKLIGENNPTFKNKKTGSVQTISNVNSRDQLLPWLQQNGYPFDDLQKDTIKKVLLENAEAAKSKIEYLDEDTVDVEVDDRGFLPLHTVRALKLRQQVARTAVTKYDQLRKSVCKGRFRFGFQFGGAARTNRWAGRRLNPQNLARPPSVLEIEKAAIAMGVDEDALLEHATELIKMGDYEGLELLVDEPLNVLAGLVRSSIRAEEGMELLAADLASIETVTIGWLSGCERLLNVFRSGKDAYIDFAMSLYNKAYEEVTKPERQKAKPAVLGCGFRLGGGKMYAGKKTGLWGYAEGMNIQMTQAEADKAVKLFRETYPEIPKLWYALEKAIEQAMRSGSKIQPQIKIGSRIHNVPVWIERVKPFLVIWLPSGRPLYYYQPRMVEYEYIGKPTEKFPDGEPYTKTNLTYMGKEQDSNQWKRIPSHGGKTTENIVQAVARDILAAGMRRAHHAGLPLCLHVHDELVAQIRQGSNEFTVEMLEDTMAETNEWCADMPLRANGWMKPFYRK
jgi:DNA polymerase